MQRYLDSYIVDVPSNEISEQDAQAAEAYVVEERPAGGPLHLRDVTGGQLERVIYPNAAPSAEIAAWQRAHYPGVASWIVSPVVKEGQEAGEVARYSIWYVDEDAVVGKRVDYENSARLGWSRWYHPDGTFGGALERRYDEHGDSIEVREHSPDGRVSVIDD